MGEELKRVVAYKLLSADRDTVIDGLMEMVFAVGDVTWVSERLCEQADSANTEVSSLAIPALGIWRDYINRWGIRPVFSSC